MGAEQHGVALQVLQGGVVQVEGVHGGVGQLAGHEQLHLAGVGQVAVPGVQLGVEHVVVVLHQAQQGDVLRPGHLLDGLHPGVEPLELRQLPVGPVVIVQQAVPVHLRAVGDGAPPEEADIVRAVGDALHGPQHHLAGLGRRGRPGGAAPRAGLLLHNAEVGAHRAHFHQVLAPLPVV